MFGAYDLGHSGSRVWGRGWVWDCLGFGFAVVKGLGCGFWHS